MNSVLYRRKFRLESAVISDMSMNSALTGRMEYVVYGMLPDVNKEYYN
jgi:hypothetical protein